MLKKSLVLATAISLGLSTLAAVSPAAAQDGGQDRARMGLGERRGSPRAERPPPGGHFGGFFTWQAAAEDSDCGREGGQDRARMGLRERGGSPGAQKPGHVGSFFT